MKKRILELCMLIHEEQNIKCEAYFSNVHYSGYKVSILYGKDLYQFKTYREALNFLES